MLIGSAYAARTRTTRCLRSVAGLRTEEVQVTPTLGKVLHQTTCFAVLRATHLKWPSTVDLNATGI